MRPSCLIVCLVLGSCLALAGERRPPAQVRQYEQATVVQGLTLRGRAEFRADGSLEAGTLAQSTCFGPTRLAEGTLLHLSQRGELDWCFLPRDQELQGHLCQGGGDEWMTLFHPDGSLKSAGLAREELIDGVPCDVGTFWTEVFGGGGRTHFHPNGRLAAARVAREVKFQGRTLRKGEHVRLDGAGRLLEVE